MIKISEIVGDSRIEIEFDTLIEYCFNLTVNGNMTFEQFGKVVDYIESKGALK